MRASDIPPKFSIPFAADAGVGYIVYPTPVASQIGITNGAASLTDGFPPLNFIPIEAGGVPPGGGNFNGILKQITLWTQWQNAGATVIYDATFQSEIGGYPAGAIVMSATTFGLFWLSTVDNNATNPDTGGAGWARFTGNGGVREVTAAGSATITNADAVVMINKTVPAATIVNITAGVQSFKIIDEAGNSDVYPITINPPGSVTINGVAAGVAIQNPFASLSFDLNTAGTNYAAS